MAESNGTALKIELSAALSPEYQVAFKAASDIAKTTEKEIGQITKRQQQLTELQQKAAAVTQAKASGDEKAITKTTAAYGKMAEKLGVAGKSAEDIAHELDVLSKRKRGLEDVAKSAQKQVAFQRAAQDVQRYTKATEKIKDPVLMKRLEESRKRAKALGVEFKENTKSAKSFVQALSSMHSPVSGFASSLSSLSSTLGSGVGVAGTAALAVSGIAAVGAAAVAAAVKIVSFTKSTAIEADEIAKNSRALGINAEAYQELEFAMKRGGATAEGFSSGIKTLNSRLQQAREGDKTSIKLFKDLGISLNEIKTLNAEELFMRAADGMSQLGDTTEIARTSQKLFGTEGYRLAEAMSVGTDALMELRKEARDNGYVILNKDLANAEAAVDALTNAEANFKGAMNSIAVQVMPYFTEALNKLSAFMRDHKDSIWDVWEALKKMADYVAGPFILGIKTACKAVEVMRLGIEWWQDAIAGALLSVDRFVQSVPERFERLKASVIDWARDIKSSAAAWLSGFIDYIKSSVLSGLSSLVRDMADMPLIGGLLDKAAGAIDGLNTGSGSITINNTIDARGAAPGAGAEINRAISVGNSSAYDIYKEAMAADGLVSYAGAR